MKGLRIELWARLREQTKGGEGPRFQPPAGSHPMLRLRELKGAADLKDGSATARPQPDSSLHLSALCSMGPDSRTHDAGPLLRCPPAEFSKWEDIVGGPELGEERGWVVSVS